MVLKLYSTTGSACAQRVAVVLNEKGIPFELSLVDAANGEHKGAEYLKKQPFGQIPYIDDDGFILYESRAICRYIEAKYPGKGIKLAPTPDDVKAFGLFEQAASVEVSNFNPCVTDAVVEKFFKQLSGLIPDEEVFQKHLQSVDRTLRVYNQILHEQKYIAGDEITMVDLFHLPYGAMFEGISKESLTKYPNVDRWWTEISTRPSWVAIAQKIISTAA